MTKKAKSKKISKKQSVAKSRTVKKAKAATPSKKKSKTPVRASSKPVVSKVQTKKKIPISRTVEAKEQDTVAREVSAALVVPNITPQETVALKSEEPVQPPRSPRRRIVDGKKGIIEVAPVVKEQPAESVATVRTAEKTLVLEESLGRAPFVEWNTPPREFPVGMRVLVALVHAELAKAAASPFSFARLLEALPRFLSATEFMLLAFGAEVSNDEFSRAFGVSSMHIAHYKQTAQEELRERFSALCPDLYRQWAAAAGGKGVRVDSLVERFLITSVDKEVQLLIGSLLVVALGGSDLSRTPGMYTPHPGIMSYSPVVEARPL